MSFAVRTSCSFCRKVALKYPVFAFLALRSPMTTNTETPLNPVAAVYAPYRLNQDLFEENFQESWLHPDFLEIINLFQKAPKDSNPLKITSLLKEEALDVYSFPCFSTDFLDTFNAEIQNFYRVIEQKNVTERLSHLDDCDHTVNNYGVIMTELGMKGMLSSLQQRYILPLSRRLFPVEGKSFDDHHSFLVRYQADEDLGLDMHIDDSDVTFNVCLGEKGFTGATLAFCGYFGEPDHRHLSHVYNHEIGRAVLHLGTRRHGAEDIESGARCNLIVWNYNKAYRQSDQYRASRLPHRYRKESGEPDPICLSETHDRDFSRFRKPSGAPKHMHPWCPPEGKEYDGFYDVTSSDEFIVIARNYIWNIKSTESHLLPSELNGPEPIEKQTNHQKECGKCVLSTGVRNIL
eukprot:scaffold7025_cov123-Cylindrotheca_fusiformis.AAC.2